MKVGRNDACPCGSGQKYKRCCESKDAAARSAELAALAAERAAAFAAQEASAAEAAGSAPPAPHVGGAKHNSPGKPKPGPARTNSLLSKRAV